MCMCFRESHLSGTEVVLCRLPPGRSFWNTASYRKIWAVRVSTGLLARLFGIAKTCFPSVIECFICLMLYVRRCSSEAPLRLSHHSRRKRSFMFSQTSHFLVETVLPLAYLSRHHLVIECILLLSCRRWIPVVVMFSLGVLHFLRTVGVFSCALQDLSLYLRFYLYFK